MIDIDVNKFLYGFSVISYFIDFLHVLRKVICMALGCSSSLPSSSSSSSSSSWISCFQSSSSSPIFFPKGMTLSFNSKHYSMDNNNSSFYKTISKGLPIILEEELPKQNFICSKIEHKEAKDQFVPPLDSGEYPSENSSILMQERLLDSRTAATSLDIGKVKLSSKIKKRPARLVVPESFSGLDLCEVANHEPSQKEFQIEGKNFFFASRRGRRQFMEDGYQVITDIMGDSQQAYFGVFDGHGGRAAVDFVTENLGKKIVAALREVEETKDQSREAIKKGYLATDTEFLSQDVSSGACAATVIMKNGEMYIANVGDCRVVLSRKGISTALTSDHRLDREDERLRIDSLGGYVNCQNGVWRVQGSLAVSRAIGDSNLKQWVVSEPEIKKLEITSDCEFLVLASDGLWDKVSNQEAVDIVSGHKNSIESCKKLVDISFSRGSKDDISVMVIDLQNFKRQKE